MSTSDPKGNITFDAEHTTNASPPSSLSVLLTTNTPLILDGALATYLETLGADISGSLWSASLLLDQPSLIHRTHLDYYIAGADISITASYQASIPGLQKHLNLSEHEAKDVVKKSVELATQARSDYLSTLQGEEKQRKAARLLVAGSVGPYGAFLADGSEYRGDYSIPKQEMKDFHRGRMSALVSAGADVLAIETIPSYPETEALVELLSEEFSSTEAWFSFTLKDSEHISDGTSLSDVTSLLNSHSQVVALGVNCVPEESALGALKQLAKLTSKPLVVYPNSGEVWDAASRSWTGDRKEGEGLVERTREWWDAGARLMGGCCRTTPEDIEVIERTLRDIET